MDKEKYNQMGIKKDFTEENSSAEQLFAHCSLGKQS